MVAVMDESSSRICDYYTSKIHLCRPIVLYDLDGQLTLIFVGNVRLTIIHTT